MKDKYLDNPYSVEAELNSYTEKELEIWNKGYLTAILGLLEQLTDDKIRVLTRMMSLPPGRRKALLQSRLSVLDAYEEHYSNRANVLEGII